MAGFEVPLALGTAIPDVVVVPTLVIISLGEPLPRAGESTLEVLPLLRISPIGVLAEEIGTERLAFAAPAASEVDPGIPDDSRSMLEVGDICVL